MDTLTGSLAYLQRIASSKALMFTTNNNYADDAIANFITNQWVRVWHTKWAWPSENRVCDYYPSQKEPPFFMS